MMAIAWAVFLWGLKALGVLLAAFIALFFGLFLQDLYVDWQKVRRGETNPYEWDMGFQDLPSTWPDRRP